jgi:ABC-type branched-subunit amino acid transport system substrate-binding protein
MTEEQAAESPDASSATNVATTTTLRPPVPADPPEPDAPSIGELEIPCRPSPLVEIEDRPGVTDDAIAIGVGTDRGGVATLGSARGVLEMVEALADLCNAQGGLLGRDVRVKEYDAAAVEAGDRVTEACTEVSALVGSVFLQVIESSFTAISCGLPIYSTGADLVPTSPLVLHGMLAALFSDPANAATIVLVGPNTAAATADRAGRRAAIEAADGFLSVVGEIAYPIDDLPDWDRIVDDARATGAGQVNMVGGCEQAVLPFTAAAEAAGWQPMIVATAAAYDDTCLTVENPSRLLVELPFLPFEDGDAAPAAAAHAALLDRTAAPQTGNGILAASAFWRWATAVETCLPDSDRECFARFSGSQDGWTAGGLHLAIALDGTTEGCAVVLGVEAGAFVRRLPAEVGTFDCNPQWSAVVP